MALPLQTVARQLFLGATCSAIINQCPCATVKSHAVLIPNSSIPLTDSRAPINCQCRCSVSPDAPRVLIESMEKSKASVGESRAPSHKYATAQIPHSITSTTANSSPITPTIQVMIGIRCHKTKLRVSSRSRIFTATIPIVTTAAACDARVNAMSDRPQRQLGYPTPSNALLKNGFAPFGIVADQTGRLDPKNSLAGWRTSPLAKFL